MLLFLQSHEVRQDLFQHLHLLLHFPAHFGLSGCDISHEDDDHDEEEKDESDPKLGSTG